tara:strand:- start:234 stop:344 length:111 start_codon:yes stop_codon:yes gene_type:complete
MSGELYSKENNLIWIKKTVYQLIGLLKKDKKYIAEQ